VHTVRKVRTVLAGEAAVFCEYDKLWWISERGWVQWTWSQRFLHDRRKEMYQQRTLD